MNPTTRLDTFALSAPSPESLRDRRPREGDPRLPTVEAFAQAPYSRQVNLAENAELLARHLGHQLIRRGLRVGAHLDAPVHALAHTAVRSNTRDAADSVGPVAAGIRCVATWAPVRHAAALEELARILVGAAEAAGIGFYRDRHPGLTAMHAEASSSVTASLALHARLDALLTEDAELRTVIHDCITGDLFVCEYVRGGKTFAEYRTRRGSTLRVDSKSTHRFARV